MFRSIPFVTSYHWDARKAPLALVALSLFCSCVGRKSLSPLTPAATATQAGSSAPPAELPDGVTLSGKYAPYFPLGVAVGQSHLSNPEVRAIITTHFNHLTAENAFKFGSLSPREGSYDWHEADAIARFARKNEMRMTGHTLVWHRQTPNWLFADLQPGLPKSIEKLKARMKTHIDTIIGRYADVVDNWDVVNEAISDNGDKTFRDGSEGSRFFDIFGNEDYVYWAFKVADDALAAQASEKADGKLYYNDYNVNLKLDRILPMLDKVRERGARVDGIGMQMHVRIDWPSIQELESTLRRIISAGYEVKISELDVSLYNDYPGGKFQAAPALEFTPNLAQTQAKRYAELFSLFRKYAPHITSVTLWGVSDDATWLDHEPVPGRDNHPLLFDDRHQPKAAAAAIVDF